MDLGVRDRAFLVVGGTAGIGRAAAAVLAAEGARVAICGRDGGRAQRAATELSSDVVAIVGDASAGQGACDDIVGAAVGAVGPLDGVAVTAGSNRSAHSTLEDATDDMWHETFRHQLLATVGVVKAALPAMVARRRGTVVTTAAYSIRSPHANRVPYVSCKSALATFTKNVAKNYGRDGIRANCVCPGAIETDHLASRRAELAAERGVSEDGLLEALMRDEWHMDVALGRLGRPEEAGELIAFLLSQRAAYLTGALVNIDGGTDF